MGAKLGSGGGAIADINVTPLIDVVLVLLVVFMVITPMLSSGLPVDLPKASTTVTVNDVGQHIVISITHDGRWAVEQEDANEDNLIDLINAEMRKAEVAKSILIKADRTLPYKEVRKVMDILGENGQTSLMVAANKE